MFGFGCLECGNGMVLLEMVCIYADKLVAAACSGKTNVADSIGLGKSELFPCYLVNIGLWMIGVWERDGFAGGELANSVGAGFVQVFEAGIDHQLSRCCFGEGLDGTKPVPHLNQKGAAKVSRMS
ncbi:hypothetical protein ACSQ67_006291 [Phaseolus vulgaris]